MIPDSSFLIGTGVALITPFNVDLQVDYKGLEKLINKMISGGVNYLVVLGTTGETATLTQSERQDILSFCKEIVAQRVPIILGIGGNNTAEVIHQFSEFKLEGVSAILSVSPYYNKPTQEGIYHHYAQIAKNSPLPIILYNVPGRTGSNISANTTLRLANDFQNIIGIKEASGNLEQCMVILKDKPNEFKVISGDDLLTLPLLFLGAEGVISVAAMGAPKKFSAMVKGAIEKNDINNAIKYHYDLIQMMQLIFEEGNPGGIKALLKIQGVCDDHLRLPLYPVSSTLRDKLSLLDLE